MTDKLNFEFSPNLIRLLGEELIHDKKIAISELVKNSYDADASTVNIEIHDDELIIEDDGFGMDYNTIKNVWLRPGVSSKNNDDKSELTPKYKRTPIGEKGIGRLGCHKLGNIIEIYTKQKNSDEVHFQIDWEKFEQAKSIQSFDVNVEKNILPVYFTSDKTGTRIVIKKLKDKWTKTDKENLSIELSQLISLFHVINDFKILFKEDDNFFSNDLKNTSEWVRDNALFYFQIEFRKGKIEEFNYQFKPWKGFEKVSGRKIDLKNDRIIIEKILGKSTSDNNTLSVNNYNDEIEDLGKIRFEGFIYDFDNTLWLQQHQFSKENKRIIKKFMKENGGIRVYKDNLRVFNYGEPGTQIIDLDLKRVNRPAGKISSNQILASVILDRKDSHELKEKTNREGFIHNKHFSLLQNDLNDLIDIIGVLWKDDKNKIRKIYANKEFNRSYIDQEINKIKDIIAKSSIDNNSKNTIKSIISKFSEDFNNTKDVFLSASQSGIGLAFVIHEIDKLLDEIKKSIKDKNWELMSEHYNDLFHIVSNYKDTIRLDKESVNISLSELIKKAVFNVKSRLSYDNIELIIDIDKEQQLLVKRNLILGVFNNLFDNSIYWLKYQNIKNKKIMIKSYREGDEIHIVFADNGKGFTISFESALSAFITGRKDDSSMGIGLYLISIVMDVHSGFIEEGIWENEKLAEDFKEGAIVKLIFKEVNNV